MPKNDAGPEDLASRLRAARRQAGLSQAQAAEFLGLHRPAISEIEAGRRRVTADELAKFAEIYKVSVSWLATNDPEVPDAAVQLAARELSKLSKDDLDALMKLFRTLRKREQTK